MPQEVGIDAAGVVENRARGIAIPKFPGAWPLGVDLDNRAERRSDMLPVLVPRETGLSVKALGTDLLVESQEEIILARPDWHFLVRWWVNGKPFVPKQIGSFMDQNGMMIFGRKLLLRVNFRPERFGARAGDKIVLQLLYCKRGWMFVFPGHEMLDAFLDEQDPSPELLLSNRVQIDWDTPRKGAGKGSTRPERN
jgi:hypothetical protein